MDYGNEQRKRRARQEEIEDKIKRTKISEACELAQDELKNLHSAISRAELPSSVIVSAFDIRRSHLSTEECWVPEGPYQRTEVALPTWCQIGRRSAQEPTIARERPCLLWHLHFVRSG
jgi:hypothetical protein